MSISEKPPVALPHSVLGDTRFTPKAPREHLVPTNTTGAAGERDATGVTFDEGVLAGGSILGRPTGEGLKVLLKALAFEGFKVKHTGFDNVWVPRAAFESDPAGHFHFENRKQVAAWVTELKLIEWKSCTQDRAGDGFSQYLFALTGAELEVAEQLGPDRYKVVLHNRNSGLVRVATVPEIIEVATTAVWQLTVQLAPNLDGWSRYEGQVVDLEPTDPIGDLFAGEGEGPKLLGERPKRAPVEYELDVLGLFGGE
jgi:hypothetical protein